MQEFRKNIKGRGASSNTDIRFESQKFIPEPGEDESILSEEERPLLRTQFIRDFSKSIVAENDSPDIPFRYSVNPYRGCEHGCAYCYARPTHEYLGFSAGLDFESKIMVKQDAAKLLRERLMAPSWKGEHICFSGNTDCYQPVERRLKITRACLEVMLEYRNPLSVITKNALITRDADLLAPLAKMNAALVVISMTTLDAELCAHLEPRTSRPQARLEAIRTLSSAGIPVSVNVAPVIPGLTDHEMPKILKSAREAGAVSAGMAPVRLPLAVTPIFEEWLSIHRPEKKEKVLQLIKSMRGGKLNDGNFVTRFRGEGAIAANIKKMFEIYSRKEGFDPDRKKLSSDYFSRPGDQLSLL